MVPVIKSLFTSRVKSIFDDSTASLDGFPSTCEVFGKYALIELLDAN